MKRVPNLTLGPHLAPKRAVFHLTYKIFPRGTNKRKPNNGRLHVDLLAQIPQRSGPPRMSIYRSSEVLGPNACSVSRLKGELMTKVGKGDVGWLYCKT